VRSSVAYRVDLSKSDLECTHCGVRTTKHEGSGKRIRYFNCPTCYRWVADCYGEVLQADTKFRARAPEEETPRRREFTQVRDRLERWLVALDDQDPYRLLGVSPLDSDDVVRNRYRELALQCHPDRGGSDEQMRQLNDAYERIVSHRERRRSAQLPEGRSVPVKVPLAARAR